MPEPSILALVIPLYSLTTLVRYPHTFSPLHLPRTPLIRAVPKTNTSRSFFFLGHYVENTGNTTLSYMEIFKSDKVVDFSLQQWLALTPNDLVAQILNVTIATVKGFKTSKSVVVMGK